MKVAAIVKALDEFRDWHADHGQPAEAAALQDLAALLKEHERKNVSDLADAIRASRLQESGSMGRERMTGALRPLQDLLVRIALIADALGGRGQAGDLRLLSDVLAEEPATSVKEAVIEIRSRLARFPSRGRRRTNSPVKRQPKRPTVSVDEYVRMLECAKEEADIYPLLQEFRDRAFKKTELDKIAHRFAKGPEKYRKKADAILDIEGRFFQRKRSANEIDFLDRKKVTPW